MDKKCFLLRCKSRNESRAQLNLSNQGIISFYPKRRIEKIIRGKISVVEEALFPCYIFVSVSMEDPNFNRIRSTRGVQDFVRFGGKIAEIPLTLLTELKTLCYELNDKEIDRVTVLKSGDKVEILHGSFKGLTAIFESNDGLERSLLLLDILNQENKISFPNTDLKKMDP